MDRCGMSNYLRRNFKIKLNRSESVSLIEDHILLAYGIGIPKSDWDPEER